jgi:hypothetical protein
MKSAVGESDRERRFNGNVRIEIKDDRNVSGQSETDDFARMPGLPIGDVEGFGGICWTGFSGECEKANTGLGDGEGEREEGRKKGR